MSRKIHPLLSRLASTTREEPACRVADLKHTTPSRDFSKIGLDTTHGISKIRTPVICGRRLPQMDPLPDDLSHPPSRLVISPAEIVRSRQTPNGFTPAMRTLHMQFTAMTARLCGGLVLLALLGCHTYSPYGPYQYGYPPGGSNAPGNYVTPPGGTVPQGTVPPTNSLGQPGKIPEDGTGSPSAPRPSGASTGNKPAFEANRNGGLLPNEKPVPVPGKFDSTAFPGPSSEAPKPKITPAKNSTGSEDAGKAGDGGKNGGLFPGPSPFDGSAANSAGGGNTIQPTGGELKQSPDIEPGKFQVPKAGTPIPKSGQPFNSTTPAGKTTAAPKPNPYDYDKKSYAWLRGTLDFDETTKT
ncbi:MAG: hypothetical protein ACE5KM_03875, partial [Planctomycetaceae bacterium]